LTLVSDDLPAMKELSSHQELDDLFVCALGFEDRCTEALRKLTQWGYKAQDSIILKYDVHQEDNDINSKELKELIDQITLREIREIKYSTTSVLDSFHEIKSCLEVINYETAVNQTSVDISSFSTGAIFQVLDSLFRSGRSQIRIIYTEAAEYYPKKAPARFDEEYMSAGVREILTLPNFGGVYTPGYSPLLVILLGFEPKRARGILNMFQPSRKIGIIGVPNRNDLKWRLELAREMYQNFFEEGKILEYSEFDYREVYKALENLYGDFAQMNNITIAPLGSKMQTLAVLLFLEKHPDVQLLVSIPTKYDPRRYSEGKGESYQISFTPGKESE